MERGPLKGREQEWNISRKELNELVSRIHPLLTALMCRSSCISCYVKEVV